MTEPTIDAPAEETKPTEPVTEPNVDDLISKINELGVTDAGQLDNMAKASREAGYAANKLGEERARSAQLEAELRELKAVPADNDDYSEGVDINKAIERGVERVWDRKVKQAADIQKMQARAQQKIRQHKHYGLVGQDFEEYMRSPDGQADMMAGKTPEDIYHDKVNDTLIDYLGQMKDAYTGVSSPASTKIPHVESNQTPTARIEPDDEKAEKLKQAKKNWKGDDKDIMSVLDTLLPPGSLT